MFFAFFVTIFMSNGRCRTTTTSKSSGSIILLMFFVLDTPLFVFLSIFVSIFQIVIVLHFLQFLFVSISVFFVSSSCYNFV